MNDTIQSNKLAAFIENFSVSPLPYSSDIKRAAVKVLSTTDFPTTRMEAWKYTRVGKIAALRAKTTAPNIHHLADKFNIDQTALTFVFNNGFFVPQLSSTYIPEGLTIKPLSKCTEEELSVIGKHVILENEVFNSINSAYSSDGLFVQIADNINFDQSIQFIHILSGTETISNTRNYISIGKFSKAHVIQGYCTEDATSCFTNVLTEINIKANACLSLDKIQYESPSNFHVATEQVNQDKDSTFTINTLTLNGTFVRNNLNIDVKGNNCTTNLNGAYLLNGNQHVDNHTTVDHLAPHCNSNELYKGVIDENATAVFNGKVFVRKDSQKINAFQSNANVLLGDNSTVNSKPELEIYADDVKCSHGSTTGQLDDEAIFYLRARGISEKAAKQLMVSAFIGDVLNKIENEKVLDFTRSILKERFDWEF